MKHSTFSPIASYLVPCVCFIALLLSLLVRPATAGEWPTYKHDLDRTSITDETLTFPMRTAWEFVATQKPSPAWPEPYGLLNRADFDYAPHPVIAAGIVCFGSTSDDSVRALDAKTGQEKWRFITGGPVRVAPQIVVSASDAKVYFGSDDGFVYCVSAAAGKLIWKFRAAPEDERMAANHRMVSRWPVRSGAVVADGVVYCVAGIINMEGVYAYALDAETGKVVWRNDMLGFVSVTMVDFPPSADLQKDQVGGHNGEFAANAAIGANPDGPMLVHGNLLIIPNCNSNITTLDRKTGQVISLAGTTGSGGAGGTWLTIDKDVLYSYGRHREDVQSVRATSLGGPAPKGWGANVVPQVRIIPSRKEGMQIIYARGKVSSIVRGAKLFARHAYGMAMTESALILGEENSVVAQDPQTERELWRVAVKGEPREIAVSDGRVYVGTSEGAMYCFEPSKRGETKAPAVIDPAVSYEAPAVSESVAKIVEQLAAKGMDRGFALVIGDADASMSAALAARTQLRVINATTDESAIPALREKLLSRTAFNGSRVNVQPIANFERLPFSQYFANTVIIAGPVRGLNAREIYRVLHPCGGLLFAPGLKPDEAASLASGTGATENETRNLPEGAIVARGKLPGALDWDSQNKLDLRVKWPLRPLWIGGPSTDQIHSAGGGGPGPLIANGRYFVRGEQSLTAVDAYNGEILWTRPVPKDSPEQITLGGVVYPVLESVAPTREELGRNMSADNDYVYMQMGPAYFQSIGDDITNELDKATNLKSKSDGRIQIDARNGAQVKIAAPYNPPAPFSLKNPQKWTITIDARRNGAIEMKSGAKGIELILSTQDTLVTPLDAWDLYFDFRAPEVRAGLYERGTFTIHVTPSRDKNTPAAWTKGTGEAIPMVEVDGSRDAAGTVTHVLLPWKELESLTGARPASFGFAASLNSHSGAKGEPIVRRHLFCDWTADGLNNGWASVSIEGSADAVKKPAIFGGPFPRAGGVSGNGDNVTAARELPRVHPITGDLVPKMFRLGGCGGVSSSAQIRSGSQSIYDFMDDSGMRPLGGVKARCSTPQTAALGLLIYSEEAGHCVCPYPIRSTLVMAPAERRLNEDWAFYFDRPADTYLRQAAINFGAPGDRRDEGGTLWLGYPRIPGDRARAFPVAAGSERSVGANGVWLRVLSASLQLPVEVEFLGEDAYKTSEDVVALRSSIGAWSPARKRNMYGPYRENADAAGITGTDRPWIYASGIRGISKAKVKLDFLQPVVSAKVDKMPAINAKLDGDEWKIASSRLPFTKTDIFVRHDADNLYIIARRPSVVDRLGKLVRWSTHSKGDDAAIWNDDSFEVFVSNGTGGVSKLAKVIHLGVAASGARFDALAEESGEKENAAWNGDWKSAVVAEESALVIEFALPWKTIESAGLSKDRLSVNFQMNQRDVSGEPQTAPGSLATKGGGTSGEALSYLGMTGRARCQNFAIVGLGAMPEPEPRYYTVRLHFAELDNVKPGERVFDVKIQDQTMIKGLDLAREPGMRAALVKEFQHVPASQMMKFEFTSEAKELSPSSTPILSALEIIEEGYVRPKPPAPR